MSLLIQKETKTQTSIKAVIIFCPANKSNMVKYVALASEHAQGQQGQMHNAAEA